MVLDEDTNAMRVGKLTEAPKPVGGELLLLLVGEVGVAAGVDAHRVAAEGLRGLDPLAVILDRAGSLARRGIAEIALAIAHDEKAPNAIPLCSVYHLPQVPLVARFVHEELIHVLDAVEAVVLSRPGDEIEVAHGAGEESSMERPLRERDAEEGLRGKAQEGEAGKRSLEEISSVHSGIV